ncbi:MAG TPA: hypothetical protein VF812_11970 [Ktedonobacterales bacterium]
MGATEAWDRDVHSTQAAPRQPARWRPKRGRLVLARREEYQLRYTVERSFAWLGAFRWLLIRWEHLLSVYRSGFAFVVMWICVRRVTARGSTTLVQ